MWWPTVSWYTHVVATGERELLLTFSVAERLFALSTRWIREIVFLPATASLPAQPIVVHGFLNFRGESVAVISLRALLQDPVAEPGIYAPVIVLRDGPGLALLADQVHDIIDPASVVWQRLAPGTSVNDCAEAVGQTDAGSVTILSAERLLLAQERERVAELQQQAKDRLLACQAGPH